MSRRGRFWVIAAFCSIAVFLAFAAFVPVPYVADSPGPVFDILGRQDGRPVLTLSGARTYPTTGQLDMTTVSQRGGSTGPMTVGSAVVALFEPDSSVAPDENPGTDDSDLQLAVFDASQSKALGAAAELLGRPVRVQPVIIGVTPDSPASGVFTEGDLIDSIDGRPMKLSGQVGRIIKAQPPGTRFTFVVTRGDETLTRRVVSQPDPEDGRPVVGIFVDNHYSSDFTATVNLSEIGGPSAGLMLALGMVDRLTPQDLLEGRHVAGTGTIDGRGRVGPIGGIDKKMIAAQQAGAELFLAPRDNCADVAGTTPAGLAVTPVSSLSEAVAVVHDWQDGKPLPSCPADSGTQDNG